MFVEVVFIILGALFFATFFAKRTSITNDKASQKKADAIAFAIGGSLVLTPLIVLKGSLPRWILYMLALVLVAALLIMLGGLSKKTDSKIYCSYNENAHLSQKATKAEPSVAISKPLLAFLILVTVAAIIWAIRLL